MKRRKMPLPIPKRCFGCLSLETGFYILCTISLLACLANIAVGAWNLPRHREREPEDNYISMSMVMFSSISSVGTLMAAAGVYFRRPNYLQLSLIFNFVFILCIFLVATVTCIFSPELKKSHFLETPGNVAAVVIAMLAGVAYSLYYLMMTNAMYRVMKMTDSESAIPI